MACRTLLWLYYYYALGSASTRVGGGRAQKNLDRFPSVRALSNSFDPSGLRFCVAFR